METLFIHSNLHGFFLKDSRSFVLGHFKSREDAIQWCQKNQYKVRYEENGKSIILSPVKPS